MFSLVPEPNLVHFVPWCVILFCLGCKTIIIIFCQLLYWFLRDMILSRYRQIEIQTLRDDSNTYDTKECLFFPKKRGGAQHLNVGILYLRLWFELPCPIHKITMWKSLLRHIYISQLPLSYLNEMILGDKNIRTPILVYSRCTSCTYGSTH